MADADSFQRNTKESIVRRWLDRYKEFLTVFGGTLDIFLKTSPLALFPPALLLWVYLKRLGWSEIFLSSVGSTAGLITLFATSIALAVGLLLQFCFPSLIISSVAGFFKTEPTEKISDRKLAAFCLLPAIGWITAYGLTVWLWSSSGMWSIAIATGCAGIIALALAYWLRHYIETSRTSGKCEAIIKVIAAAWWPVAGAVCSTFPLLVSMWIFEKQPLVNAYPLPAYLICALLSIAGLLPGFVMVSSRVSQHSAAKTVALTSGVLFSVAYLLGGLVLALAPISAIILGNASVYKTEPQTYQILKPELAYSMRAIHLPVYPVSGSAKAGDQPVQFVGGFDRYSFGGITLICRTFFQPQSVTTDDIQTAAQQKRPNPYLQAGDWCVPVKSDDVLPIRRDKATQLVKRSAKAVEQS